MNEEILIGGPGHRDRVAGRVLLGSRGEWKRKKMSRKICCGRKRLSSVVSVSFDFAICFHRIWVVIVTMMSLEHGRQLMLSATVFD